LLTAASRIQVKQMRNVKPFVLAAYLNLTIFALSLTGNVSTSILTGQSISELWNGLPPFTYVLISLSSVLMILAAVTRIYAVKNLSVSRLSVFMQMGLLIQILVDIFVLGFTFTYMQMVGFAMMLALYILLFAGVCC
jgi:drug/metabolite transporter (DMT)-like permease